MDIDDLAPGGDHPVPTHARLALAVFAVLFALFFFRAAPLQLDPVRAENSPTQFDATRAIDRLSRVLDGKPHPVDSDTLDATRARLLQEIQSLGYTPDVKDETGCRSAINGSATRCARVQNIVFRAGPATGPALVLTAHYDSVDASPGFGDDGIGVAVWLEVAQHLKETPPAKPVVFLITDGEEAALLGAQAFVQAKSYGIEIGRIINLEARGVRGPAMMFETGHPNAGVVSDWAKSGARPFSNSMMTAVYELLPNSTDLTVHLNDGHNGVNIAISDGLDFYHTAHDDLAHLDRASVQHMGDQALGATRAFLAGDWSIDKRPGADIAYSDIASRVFVAMPQMIAAVLLGLCFGLAAIMFMRPARNANWKKPDLLALALPPAIYVASGLIAFAAQFLIGFVRPEPAFWIAHGQALNSVYFIGVLIACALGLAYLAPKSRREAIYASGWLWFLVVGMGVSFAVPGFSIIFLIPGIVFVVAGAVGWVAPRVAVYAHAVAGLFLLVGFFPLAHLLDVTMGLGLAAMFGVVEAMAVVPALAVVGPIVTGRVRVLVALAAALVVAVVVTVVVPAFSPERPLALNFTAHYDVDAKQAALFASASPGALPKDVKSQLSVGDASVMPGITTRLAQRPLDYVERPSATLTSSGDGMFQVSAPGARMVRVRVPADYRPAKLIFDGNIVELREPQNGYFILDCIGRACDGARFGLTVDPEQPAPKKPPEFIVQGFWPGLPPDAQVTADARGDAALPIQMGDVTITTRRQAF